jgi:tripartite-type tricarboxylate transporter receptor subunit TctC
MTFGNVSQQIGYLNAGRLRALAITSARRSPVLPNLPTVAEAGVPDYEFTTWHGIVAPRATPPAVVAVLNEQIRKLLTAPDQARMWQERGLDIIASTPEAFAAHLLAEQKKWGRVVRERGIKAE